MNDTLILDKASILARLGGDEDLYGELVSMYLQEAEAYAQALGEAFAAADAARVQREAHTIKGLLATFSDDVGTEMALALETRAKDGAFDAAAVEQLQARVHLLATVLQGDLAH